jgi:hypothetical protein
VGGQVEGDRDTLLAGGQVLAVEGVDSSAVEKPAYWRIVQGRLAYMVPAHAARERREARQFAGRTRRHIRRRIERTDVYAFRRFPGQGRERCLAQFALGQLFPIGGGAGQVGHRYVSSALPIPYFALRQGWLAPGAGPP